MPAFENPLHVSQWFSKTVYLKGGWVSGESGAGVAAGAADRFVVIGFILVLPPSMQRVSVGEGSLSVEREAKIDPDRVRALPAGQCVVIAAGRAQLVQVKRVASAADAGTGANQASAVGDAGPLLVRPAQRPPRTPSWYSYNDTHE
jgi:hypothetical protein